MNNDAAVGCCLHVWNRTAHKRQLNGIQPNDTCSVRALVTAALLFFSAYVCPVLGLPVYFVFMWKHITLGKRQRTVGFVLVFSTEK